MSASKANDQPFFGPFLIQSSGQRLTIPSAAVRVHKNGIEFKSTDAFAPWTEMTVEMEVPMEERKIQAQGIIVDCQGSRHAGFVVSMLFTDLSPQTAARLHSLATGLSM